jgi:hypothetical protein
MRRLLISLAIPTALVVLGGCSDDETTNAAQSGGSAGAAAAGKGGSAAAGKGGSAGATGGSAGATGGKGGTGGTTGGSGGTAGKGGGGAGGSTGGSAGTAGASGKGGSAGGGAGGATGGKGGTGGATGGTGGTGGATGGKGGTGGATGGTGGAGGSTGVTTADIRFAHLSPDVPAAIRVCAAKKGTTTFSDLTPAAGASYKDVTAYATVPAGDYDAKVVLASGTCADMNALPATIPLTVAAGKAYTVAASGLFVGGTLQIDSYVDDRTAVDATSIAMRFIHSSKGTPAVDVGAYNPVLGDGSLLKPFASTAYSKVGAGTDALLPTDALGYITLPLSALGLMALPKDFPFEVRLAQTGGYFATVGSPVALPGGARVTLFAHGTLPTVGVRACLDSASPANGLAVCVDLDNLDSVAKAPAATARLAHFLAGPAVVDVCLRPTTYGTWDPANAQRVATGLSFPAVTRNLQERADTYRAKVVITDKGCDATGADVVLEGDLPALATAGATTMTPPSNVTVAVGGAPAASTPIPIGVSVWANEDTPTDNTKSWIRFGHVAANIEASLPAGAGIDAGLVGAASALTGVWINTHYGKPAGGTGVDAAGYVATTLTGATLGAGINAGAPATTAVYSTAPGAVTLTANMPYTAWALDGTPPGLLLCDDSKASDGGSGPYCTSADVVPLQLDRCVGKGRSGGKPPLLFFLTKRPGSACPGSSCRPRPACSRSTRSPSSTPGQPRRRRNRLRRGRFPISRSRLRNRELPGEQPWSFQTSPSPVGRARSRPSNTRCPSRSRRTRRPQTRCRSRPESQPEWDSLPTPTQETRSPRWCSNPNSTRPHSKSPRTDGRPKSPRS